MEILGVGLTERLDANVKVTVLNKEGKKINVCVQGKGGRYIKDLDCMVCCEDGGLSEQDFDDYDSDIEVIMLDHYYLYLF